MIEQYTNLTDEQWQAIEGIVPACQAGGRPAKWKRRDIVDAILYKFYTDCSWRQLPDTYPNWNTVFVYYNRWVKDGIWDNVIYNLGMQKIGSRITNMIVSSLFIYPPTVT